MHKTVYVDTDEEIIEIINKIRKEEVADIFLVIPKNSLLTQGIINLKLLKKEVAKMNKNIILVTSDQTSKKIIERVGLKTKNKSIKDFVKEDESESKAQNENFTENISQKNPKRTIGSSDFYNNKKENFSEDKTLNLEEENIIPDTTLEKRKMKIQSENSFGKEHIENYQTKKEIEKQQQPEIIEQKTFKINSSFDDKKTNSPETTIDDFYGNEITNKNNFELTNESKNNKEKSKVKTKVKFWKPLLFLIVFLLLIAFGYWIFCNWPKMKVELFLKEEIVETSLDLNVCAEENSKENCLKGKFEELIIEVNEKYDATGEKFSNDKGMARGIVKIYNNYSSKDQPLIATTRLLSKEGKLFRLLKGVTVPGITDGKPGNVEVQVIADAVGQDYNIKPTEFTIEGFKGGDKYNKFKVTSENSTTGGTNDNENKKVKVVTDQDINSAREKTIESFNNKLEKNIKNQLGENEQFVLSSIKKEIINSDSSFASGDIINQFDYKIQEKITLITFSKENLENSIINALNEKDLKNLEFSSIDKIDFKKDISNFETKELSLSIEANAIYWPILDKNQIKENLSDENSSQIKNYLSSLTGIERALISYTPAWLSTLPVKSRNVTIKESK